VEANWFLVKNHFFALQQDQKKEKITGEYPKGGPETNGDKHLGLSR
jgi:hypothetical protein